MTTGQQIDAFSNDLDKLVNRYRAEFDLTFAAAIGVLQMKSWLLMQEASELDDDKENGRHD